MEQKRLKSNVLPVLFATLVGYFAVKNIKNTYHTLYIKKIPVQHEKYLRKVWHKNEMQETYFVFLFINNLHRNDLINVIQC